MVVSFLKNRVYVKNGDITKEKTEAIVNAAKSTLLGGGGVDGAIHCAGGKKILEECKVIRKTEYPKGLPTGEAVITSGGNLKARRVIHTVGPVFGKENGNESILLANCYKNSLALAAEYKLTSISFPSISTGAFYYPKNLAAKVSSQAVKEFLAKNEFINRVVLVFFSQSDAQEFLKHKVF